MGLKIVTITQAEALYRAAQELRKIGAKLDAIFAYGTNMIEVRENSAGGVIAEIIGVHTEVYADWSDFAVTYGVSIN